MGKRDIYTAERAEGKTYKEIAEKYGVTRQAVYGSVNYKPSRFELSKQLKCRWPRVLLWMKENNVKQIELAKRVGVSCQTMSEWMHGYHEPKKDKIDRLLLITGLTYEELFAE